MDKFFPKTPITSREKKISYPTIKSPNSKIFLDIKQLILQGRYRRNNGSIKNFFVFLIFLFLIYITVLAPLIKTGVEIAEKSVKNFQRVQEWVEDKLYRINPLLPPYYSKSEKFFPYLVHTSYLIDDTPPGAYDFTLELNGQVRVPIPAPCNGTIRRTRFQGRNGSFTTAQGAGQIVELICDGSNYYWLMGHLVQGSPPKKGTKIIRGQAIGLQGLTGRTSGYHVHAQIHDSDGRRITDRNVTRPIINNYIKFLRKGKSY
ncbi:MAG: M23 family metallopeptidase [Microcoleaceae cyanobacterium]